MSSTGKSAGAGKEEGDPAVSIPPLQRLKNLENDQPPDLPNPSITIEFYIMRARELYKHGSNFLQSGVLEQSYHNCLRAFTILDKRLQLHPEYVSLKPEMLEDLRKIHLHTKELVELCRQKLMTKWEGEYEEFVRKQMMEVSVGAGNPVPGKPPAAKGKKNKKSGAKVPDSIPILPPPTPFAAPEPEIKILKPVTIKTEVGAGGDRTVVKEPEQQPQQQSVNFRPVGATSVIPLPSQLSQQINPTSVSSLPNGVSVNKIQISASNPALSSAPNNSKSFQVVWNNQTFESSKDNIITLLKCESCKAFLQPPIYFCPNGHSGCFKCQSKECGTCQVPFTKLRNLSAETLLAQYLVPCNYKRLGCTSKFFNHELEVHQKRCDFRPFECNLFGSHHNCSKTSVSVGKIQDHVRNGHGLKGYESETLMWTEVVTLDDEGWKFNYYSQRDHFTLSCFEQLFLVSSEWRSGTLFWIIFLVGNKDDASKFKGEITVGDDTKFSQIKWSGPTSTFRLSPLQIYQRGLGLILCPPQVKGIGTLDGKKQYKLEFNVKISQIP